nr:hypothetical protein [Tanacetum cinerariifolium]
MSPEIQLFTKSRSEFTEVNSSRVSRVSRAEKFFKNVFPTANGYKLPPSYYAIKKTFKTIELGYESIHACVNDCFLFQGDANKDVHFCPVSNTSRWKDSNTPGKKVPKKVLRYFPIIHRLQRLYKSSHTAKEMTWHATGKCMEPDKMQHPVDGKAWNDFDTKYSDFAVEPRNVRLGLAADGFNPFGNLSQSYSMWPVILTTYNLPPWLCMKESYFMLALLIPGPKSPGKDIDVYLRLLIDDLKVLWAKPGVETIDVATGLKFNIRAMVLWTINDFPARSSLSRWSGQGYKACPTCNEDTPSVRVLGKTAYVGHKRFLKKPHKWRRSLEFNGETENGDPFREFSRDAIMTQLARLATCMKGKHPRHHQGKTILEKAVHSKWLVARPKQKQKVLEATGCVFYNGKKAALKERYWVPEEDGSYDLERIRRGPCLNELSYIPLNNEQNEPSQGDIGETSNDPTQAKHNEFEELYASAIEELYPGCDYVTRLDFMDIDVYLRPLIDDLKFLWAKPGVKTIDVATGLKFNIRAMVLWTINDFPARSSLSGWSGQGYKACPTCNEDTPSVRVLGKTAYVGHRRFLKKPHK